MARADRLGDVLDDRQIMTACKFNGRRHVGGLTVEMNGDDALDAVVETALGIGKINGTGRLFHIAEDRDRAFV
ncbi:hypothetical protein D3C72_2515460 [compost metagenome]